MNLGMESQKTSYAMRVFESILYTSQGNGAVYNNIALSSNRSDVADYDPGLRTQSRYNTLAWAHFNPENGHDFETFSLRAAVSTDEMTAEARTARELILSTFVTDAAVARLPAEARQRWASSKREADQRLVRTRIAHATVAMPLSMCMISEVMGVDRTTYMLHLWYPHLLHPRPVLNALQDKVRRL